MRADGDDRGQRLAFLLGSAVEFVHAAARVQRHAEPVLAFEHETVEARGVDAASRIARRKLASGDVGRAIDGELQGDRQLGEVDVTALDNDVVPGRLRNRFAWNVFLAALAEGAGQGAR